MNFEDKLESFYSSLDLTDTTVVDIGANIGRHTIPLAKKVGPGGCVFAFEPVPLMRSNLMRATEQAEVNNVVIYPFALGAERRVAEFNYIPNLPEESGLKKRHIYNAEPSEFVKLQVGVFCLDQIVPISQGISFIKIDVEGGELDVLKGAEKTITNCRPVVAFECGAASFLGYHERPDEIFDLFLRNNYSVYSIIGTKMETVEVFSEAAFAQNFWDYIALPAEKEQYSGTLHNE